ncbi:hypothetical protein [Streptomyces noursei]|uniref:hypothetical protein n=1 Tax=Streptomyces noursei TaxID=1971 RepID=UPI0023B777A6|nr:hypothetical protein [Streptomyces noursei]
MTTHQRTTEHSTPGPRLRTRGIKARHEQRKTSAESRELRQRYGDPVDRNGDECELYLGLGYI